MVGTILYSSESVDERTASLANVTGVSIDVAALIQREEDAGKAADILVHVRAASERVTPELAVELTCSSVVRRMAAIQGLIGCKDAKALGFERPINSFLLGQFLSLGKGD
jgi:hypothetical protein